LLCSLQRQQKYYYIRAYFALSFLTTVENHQFLLGFDSAYISTVFMYISECLETEVFPFHMSMMITMLDFFRTVDPFTFYIEMIKYNMVYVLLYNIDNQRCLDFLVNICSFSDK
jgi:hypothetical protein